MTYTVCGFVYVLVFLKRSYSSRNTVVLGSTVSSDVLILVSLALNPPQNFFCEILFHPSQQDKSHTHSIIVFEISRHILAVCVKANVLMSEIPQMGSYC